MAILKTFISSSDEETIVIGREVGKLLQKKDVVCLFGDLGVGKTTFLKGLIPQITKRCTSLEVKSPTFLTLQFYEGLIDVAHFDLYRLQDSDEFFAQGFDEYLGGDLITCIEWSEKIQDILPSQTLSVIFEVMKDRTRKITLKGHVS